MKYYFLLGILLSAFLAGCAKEEELMEEQASEIEEFNFGPNPGD